MKFGKLLFVLVFFTVFPLMIFAESGIIEGKMPGGTPAMKWEDGGNDYFVMFNSLVDNKIKLYGEDETLNPQGDTCVSESSYSLTEKIVPDDAIIVKAYLVWMGAVDPSKFDQPTDNSVHLKFVSSADIETPDTDSVSDADTFVDADSSVNDSDATETPDVDTPGMVAFATPYTYEADETVGTVGKKIGAPSSVEFESIKFNTDVQTGCSETSVGSSSKADKAYFTYRKDITDFFTKIQEDGAKAGLNTGQALYGKYTLSGLDCTNNDIYKCDTTMVSQWTIFVVYQSQKIKTSKKIYVYPGLAYVQGKVSTANVSGFELPKNPILRLTTMIAEGDPGLFNPTMPKEGIFLQGEGATSQYALKNKCNPPVKTYYEVYNSVSSVIGWDPDVPADQRIECKDGVHDPEMNYGIDVDTFLLNSEEDINLQEHLHRGNTSMKIKLSVNKDAIFTNFMILSIDTKAPSYDIPETSTQMPWPYDREKHYCMCKPKNSDKDYFCGERPFYYLIKVENWGDNVAENVVVVDNLPDKLTYIPGTTEMATAFDAKKGYFVNWQKIPDKSGGAFPLSGEGYKVADKLDTCDQKTNTCSDVRLLRFKVKTKNHPSKNEVIYNTAIIKDSTGGDGYKTNKSYPLILANGDCEPIETCTEPKIKDNPACGGWDSDNECNTDSDCPNFFKCKETDGGKQCVEDSSKLCTGSKITVEEGKNSPAKGDNSSVIIPKDNDDLPLTVAQFTLMSGDNCPETNAFSFDSVTFNLDRGGDKKIHLSDFKLIYDENGNGKVDAGEKVVATSSKVESENVKFILDKKNRFFSGKKLHYFLMQAKVDYAGTTVPDSTTFQFSLYSSSSVIVHDAGKGASAATVDLNEISFATFMLEPDGDYFIVTRGPNDPPVPSIDKMNDFIPVLQIKTKSMNAVNAISSIKFRVPDTYAKFGEGIKKIAIYLDSNNNGIADPNEMEVASVSDFDKGTSVVLSGLDSKISYTPKSIRYLIVYCKFDLADKEKAKIEIPQSGGVVLQDSQKYIKNLPLRSKEFKYECLPGEECNSRKSNDSGCGCSVVDNSSKTPWGSIFSLILIALVALIFKSKISKN